MTKLPSILCAWLTLQSSLNWSHLDFLVDGFSTDDATNTFNHNNYNEQKTATRDLNRYSNKETIPLEYMSDHCQIANTQFSDTSRFVYVETAIEIALSHDTRAVDMQCFVTFAARKPNQRMLLHFESMDINNTPGASDWLWIFDGYGINMQTQLSPSHGMYGKYYQSTQSALTIYFEGVNLQSPDFKAILTTFTLPSNGTCTGSFKCALSEICISNKLLCNGLPNCGDGDRSDLDICSPLPPPPTNRTSVFPSDMGLMVGFSISIIILMVVILWLGIVCLKRTKLQSRLALVEHVTPSPNEVEGAVVEPAYTHTLVSPILAFMEPPPLYSETLVTPGCGIASSQPRFELPPPYSREECDTGRLIHLDNDPMNVVNVSLNSRILRPLIDSIMPGMHDLPNAGVEGPMSDLSNSQVITRPNTVTELACTEPACHVLAPPPVYAPRLSPRQQQVNAYALELATADNVNNTNIEACNNAMLLNSQTSVILVDVNDSDSNAPSYTE